MKTRPPTGKPAWPLILVEGEEKAGKSYLSYQLSASEHVGRTFVLDLGDGTADEYAELGPYEVVELDGTFSSLRSAVADITSEPKVDGKPNVCILDSGTQLWDSLKAWADGRARGTRKNQAVLKEDPDAEIETTMNFWNDAKDRWHEIIGPLRRWDGIAVVTAQGSDVAEVKGGRPTGGTAYSINAEKTLSANVTALVRVRRDPRAATLYGVRRLGLDLPRGGLALPLDNALEHLVFDLIGGEFATTDIVTAQAGIPVAKAKTRLVDALKHNGRDADEARAEAAELWQAAGLTGDEIAPAALAELLGQVAA